MTHGIIYCATSPSGKRYVGQSRGTLAARRRKHYADARNGSESHFHRALRKYGDKMHWAIIAEPPLHCLNEYEQFYIAEFGCRAPVGYNGTDGGDNPPNMSGRKLSPQACANIAAGKRGDKNPMKRPEVAAKNHRRRKLNGTPFPKRTEAQKEAERARRRAFYADPENRRKQSERMRLWWQERRAATAAENRRAQP